MPRVVITGLSGGTGKTTVSLGITRALTRDGFSVRPFKKGPDYIDTAWLALAAKSSAGNLDPFFLDGAGLRRQLAARSSGADIAVIEGNRGYFDGRDLSGSASTAELARHINAPVILVVDITKMTRTAAALVAGCKNFPGGERIAGVILNRAGGDRHAAIARASVEELARVPILGVLPRLGRPPIFERRAGLITVDMHEDAETSLENTAHCIREHVDLAAVLALARSAPDLDTASVSPVKTPVCARIGIVRDEALWEYYEENLDALREAGAEIIPLPLLDAAPWPEVDALYLGGGDLTPYAALLAADTARKADIRTRIESGLPVYAEHAGYFYLGEKYIVDGAAHAMAGVFPLEAAATDKPARLGYVVAVARVENPFFPLDFCFKGHEFHYARLAVRDSGVLQKTGGTARVEESDGLVYKNSFGAAMQIYAPAVPEWAQALVSAAVAWRKSR